MEPMVKLISVTDHFEAKLLRARLGADGVLCELRGPIDSAYPVGRVHLYVPADELALALALIEPLTDDEMT
jgi:hypothetical protein